MQRGALDSHIDGGKTTVGDRTADGTSKGESGVEVQTAQFRWVGGSSDIFLNSVQLGKAGRRRRGSGSAGHFD